MREPGGERGRALRRRQPIDGDGCDANCLREECENGKDANGECMPGRQPDDPNKPAVHRDLHRRRQCTTDTLPRQHVRLHAPPDARPAICDVNEIRANCSLELGQRKRLEKKLKKTLRASCGS
jgi:hypothetical protein